ncbi:dihydroxyacetone kinase family protein [Corynebacterium sp. TA-R-1]|uniref:Dihydroxyacetone kinase family protein n=1 Tax=Corynebacterium stercoris TaxID=2943490 RepID=A0ABT1FYB1_9CORY|nr:dihydroxyacetone kinase family protein [Corynebacterium stercoris]MCP1386755.1 dihydroxyacetone kinase family protein [Corynebacterium stercoris]
MAQDTEQKTFKSFRNDKSDFMAEALGGLVAAHPYAEWHDEGFIALTERDGDRVAVISGGGSGHEPMHAGFVGRGMLDAACPGLLFTSPNAVQVTAATEWADQGAGVVHVVKNYTGDVMNFTVAANTVECKVKQVLVADDVATEIGDDDSPGRRGTGATIIVEKIAGAAAARGDDLDAVAEIAQRAADRSRSMAVALQPGHLPTNDTKTFDLEEQEIEFGVGIHGEPGVERRDESDSQPSARDLVAELLDAIVQSLADADADPDGADVVLLVNGLGGTSELELDLVFGEAVRQLDERGITVRRGLRGSLVTSLNMAGVSLTLTVLDDDLVELLDAPTDAPAWPAVVADPAFSRAEAVDDKEQPENGDENAWLSAFVDRLTGAFDDLTELDRTAGDGDFGHNMEAAFGDVETPLKGSDAELLKFFAHRMLVRAGGTSGAVLGTFFREMGEAFAEAEVDSRSADAGEFAAALAKGLRAGVDAITELGGAEEGDNTVVDALAPAARKAEELADSASGSVEDVLAEVFEPAVEGAKSTRGMQAKKGRASYIGESAAEVPDPGAIAVSWLFGEAAVDEF